MKVAELSGQLLDYWACRALLAEFEGQKLTPEVVEHVRNRIGSIPFHPSTDWAQGGPIIARERIALVQLAEHFRPAWGRWEATLDGIHYDGALDGGSKGYGDTQLVAAMRAFVASRFGTKVPDEVPS
ncbi:phage protein NinX family protein [Burkholderia gladioli]|uniref:phage protein NinX family protein n=1 Tax=Burkholderia gladioli TaxID=28095 RepID=UPI00163FC9A2|nr:phage protein NinX family protein [Burkholderia gladioli]